MQKFVSFWIFLMMTLITIPQGVQAEPGVSAQAALVMDQGSGRVLYEKNAQTALPMASTTKIMTTIVALEHGDKNKIYTISAAAAGVEGSSMYLEAGEKMTLEELLYGLMLSSGNDAAVAIAEAVADNQQAFVDLMNQKAQDIGAVHTHFDNPNGLPSDQHYSTAYDMARITAYGLQNPDFAAIVATKTYSIAGEGKAYARTLSNHNKLLSMYPDCVGVKTGFTKAAGRCLVSAARRNNLTLICITLNAPDDWNDHISLFDHAFSSYRAEKLLSKEDVLADIFVPGSSVDSIPVGTAQDLYFPLAEGERFELRTVLNSGLEAPISSDSAVGSLTIQVGGIDCCSVPLIAKSDAPRMRISLNSTPALRWSLLHFYHSWLTLMVR